MRFPPTKFHRRRDSAGEEADVPPDPAGGPTQRSHDSVSSRDLIKSRDSFSCCRTCGRSHLPAPSNQRHKCVSYRIDLYIQFGQIDLPAWIWSVVWRIEGWSFRWWMTHVIYICTYGWHMYIYIHTMSTILVPLLFYNRYRYRLCDRLCMLPPRSRSRLKLG